MATLYSIGGRYPSAFLTRFASLVTASPWLRPVTASAFTAAIDPQSEAALAPRSYPTFAPAYVQALRDRRAQLSRYAETVIDPSPTPEELDRNLGLATAGTFIDDQEEGARFIASVRLAIERTYEGMTVVEQRVTLASANGVIPVVVDNATGHRLRVRIRLVSDRALNFPGGGYRDLVLDTEETAIRFPVHAQTTGLFSVKIQVLSASEQSSRDVVAESRLLVRSTAYNRVALFVTIGAGRVPPGVVGPALPARPWIRAASTTGGVLMADEPSPPTPVSRSSATRRSCRSGRRCPALTGFLRWRPWPTPWASARAGWPTPTTSPTPRRTSSTSWPSAGSCPRSSSRCSSNGCEQRGARRGLARGPRAVMTFAALVLLGAWPCWASCCRGLDHPAVHLRRSRMPSGPPYEALATFFLRWFMPQIVFYGVGAVATGLAERAPAVRGADVRPDPQQPDGDRHVAHVRGPRAPARHPDVGRASPPPEAACWPSGPPSAWSA